MATKYSAKGFQDYGVVKIAGVRIVAPRRFRVARMARYGVRASNGGGSGWDIRTPAGNQDSF